MTLLQRFVHGCAADLRHHQITQDEIELRVLFELFQRVATAGANRDLVPTFERVTERLAQQRFVVHDQDPTTHRRRFWRMLGHGATRRALLRRERQDHVSRVTTARLARHVDLDSTLGVCDMSAASVTDSTPHRARNKRR